MTYLEPRKFVTKVFGDGTSKCFDVYHGLNTTEIIVQVCDKNYELLLGCIDTILGFDKITLHLKEPLATGDYLTVVIVG